ncbi:unnamed protein product [Phytophthora fragariaefolia]|uniref:Unnamed protein product n=1 Tax=Phytophthora fragariaefolia TaxID=1490495 RepID=A0A9W6Y994_9STRA|nr:unnamed protein product [Phytophthora fragariaefolia]
MTNQSSVRKSGPASPNYFAAPINPGLMLPKPWHARIRSHLSISRTMTRSVLSKSSNLTDRSIRTLGTSTKDPLASLTETDPAPELSLRASANLSSLLANDGRRAKFFDTPESIKIRKGFCFDLTTLTELIRPTTDNQHVRMEYERGAENLPVDTNMYTGSPNAAATHVAREDCPHLADPEWEALQRLSTVIGEAAVATMLRTLSPTEQHVVALGLIMKEQREVAARATVSTPSTPRVESLNLHVNSYVRREGEPLLRWLIEVDTAITARRIVDPLSNVAFAMSWLGERTRCWAYGRRLTDPTCFSTYEIFKGSSDKRLSPPQNEFRSKAEFLDLQQGKHDVHAYAQRARYLVSNIVTNPIDEATKVVTFMKGLRDGPCTAPVHAAKGRRDNTGYRHRQAKTKATSRRGATAGDAVERVDIGHAVSKTAAPSESHTHCKKKDDKPNLVILKVNSKRERSLKALVDCGASNNFVRLQSLARLDFEEVELPRSLLEVRLATGVVVRTRSVSYAHASRMKRRLSWANLSC